MNSNLYNPSGARALILSPDPLVGALIGAAAELAGIRPVFPAAGEAAQDALRRLRPTHLLIDCADPSASNESLLGPAMMTGSRCFVFGADHCVRGREAVMLKYQVGRIVLPHDADRLADILATGATGSTHHRPRSTAR